MTQTQHTESDAEAFSKRIQERVEAGYIPDLRRMQRNEYFYQSYWRDPHFADLVMGETVRIFLGWLGKYSKPGASVLDVGCGPGYVSLELAREGYHVTGIDIAEGAIDIARATLADNPYTQTFGALEYRTQGFDDVSGKYDAILFSGSLHHIEGSDVVIRQAVRLLNPGGIVMCHEPLRDQWSKGAAAQTALIRMLLTLTGFWHEEMEDPDAHSDPAKLQTYIDDVYLEYVKEVDKREGVQSPQDNASYGEEILQALRTHLTELEYRPGFAYLYRMLGGLRGEDARIYKIADFLAMYERVALDAGYLLPSTFLFVGQLPDA